MESTLMKKKWKSYQNIRQWSYRPICPPICGDLTPTELSLEVRRKLRLTPMFRILRELKMRGINLSSLRALEMFGGSGRSYTVDYAPYVGNLEVWEIDPHLAPVLRKNLPKATVKIVDSFVELDLAKNKYDLVFIDPPYEMFDGHCEHFELFPGLFRLLNTFAILVLCNVRLNIVMVDRYSDKHFERRRGFYNVEDPKRISLEQMVKVYKNLSMQNGFEVKWSLLMDRTFLYRLQKHSVDRTCFLVLALEKQSGDTIAIEGSTIR